MSSIETQTEVVYQTEIGKIAICHNGQFVTGVFKREDSIGLTENRNPICDKACEEIEEYLVGNRKRFEFPYKLIGTAFQLRVWKELEKIPYGETRFYGEIAQAIGKPKAARAVGMANNRNPMMIVVPCHRVIGKTGKLVGYAGGVELKRKLLELEAEVDKGEKE